MAQITRLVCPYLGPSYRVAFYGVAFAMPLRLAAFHPWPVLSTTAPGSIPSSPRAPDAAAWLVIPKLARALGTVDPT